MALFKGEERWGETKDSASEILMLCPRSFLHYFISLGGREGLLSVFICLIIHIFYKKGIETK